MIFLCAKLKLAGYEYKGKVINLEYGFLESRNRISQNFFLKNGSLEFNLEKPMGALRTSPGAVCVGVGGVGWEGWVGDDYRGSIFQY